MSRLDALRGSCDAIDAALAAQLITILIVSLIQ